MNKQRVLMAITACFVAACVGPGGVVVDEEPVESTEEPVEVSELFNVSVYQDPPPKEVDLGHQIPTILLSGKGSGTTVSGFRVQVVSSEQKLVADHAAVEAAELLELMRKHGIEAYTRGSTRVYQDFRAPYYRVRVGNFLSRADAEAMLEEMEKHFEQAFIVPAQVVVDR